MPKQHSQSSKAPEAPPAARGRPTPNSIITPAGVKWPLLLVLAGLIAHGNSLKADFLFDSQRIISNPAIKNPPSLQALLQDGQRAAVNLTLWMNYRIDQANPRGYHLLNIVIHLLAALTLYGLLHRSLLRGKGQARFAQSATGIAFCTALLWVVHPLTTSAVVCTIQRAESMMSLFLLLMLYCLLRGDESRRSWAWNLLAILSCAAGMGSKAVMVIAPVVAFLFDITVLSGSVQETWRRRWKVYAFLAVTWLVLFYLKTPQGVLNPNHQGPATVGFSCKAITWWGYALSQPGVILHYLRLAFVPYPLILDYQWPEAKTALAIVPPLLVLLVLFGATVWTLIRRPPLGFVAAAFFLILAPTSSFIPIKDLAVEHRMYLPLACVLTFVVLGVWTALRSAVERAALRPSQASKLTIAGVTLLVPVLGVRTFLRNADYYSEEHMWLLVLRQRPENYRAWEEMGRLLFTEGQKTHNEQKIREAMYYSEQSLRIKPNDALANLNLGNCWYALRDIDKAAPYYETAMRVDMNMPGIANSYGGLLLSQKRYQEAIRQFRRATGQAPYHPLAYINLGLAYLGDNQLEKAVKSFRRGLGLDPDIPEARLFLAETLEKLQRTEEAILEYQKVLHANPNQERAKQRLEICLKRQSNPN